MNRLMGFRTIPASGLRLLAILAFGGILPGAAGAQEVLPFPAKPSGSKALTTIQASQYSPLPAEKRLPADAPNILIVLIDDIGSAQTSLTGGEIATPTLDRIAKEGISYNRFHTTAMCSPTRASLLTGRNHHRVASGQITELANDWDGYSGTIPKSSATVAEVLKNYGYHTGAWGKWHNSPTTEISAAGPFDNWPTGYGFEYFYGFLAGETSQYEPTMVRNTTYVQHPETSGGHDYYHVSEDLTDDAVGWLRQHKAMSPDRPFFMYWASGASHGPHHVPKEWADKYKGKFDDGWDAYRERAFEQQKKRGWIPQNAKLTERPDSLPSWDSIPEDEKPFQRRLMEVFAGFSEHVDHEVGRLVDEIEQLGYGENTMIVYIWGDNGPSAEGQNGSISELLAQNSIPTTTKQHIEALNSIGGLDVLGSPKTDNMYHAGWAWAGNTPFKSTKLVASHFGGTRNPMAIRWPAKIKADAALRSQFLHVNDVVPTIYDLLDIKAPNVVNGHTQDPIDGTSFAATFADAGAAVDKKTQYFEIMGSCGIYHDGWFAGTFGPRIPWSPGVPEGVFDKNKNFIWQPQDATWELYNIEDDWSQANDLASANPEKLQEMKDIFLVEIARNNGLPVGGGLFVPVVRPDLRLAPPYREWTFASGVSRMPEVLAPGLGNKENIVEVDVELGENANGVLYSLGGFSGGLALYVVDGVLSYEYNLFEIARTHIKATEKLPAGKVKIEVSTKYAEKKPAGPLDVQMKVNGKEFATGRVPTSAPLLFTANDCLDIGSDLGSPVSIEYYDNAPFALDGTVHQMHVKYLD